MGFYLPPPSEINWPYIVSILEGKKILLKSNQLRTTTPPPRLKELQVKKLWVEAKTNADFVRYFSYRAEKSVPDRTYFFSVLSTVYPEHYDRHLRETQEKRMQLQMNKNRGVAMDPQILALLNELNDLSLISSGKKEKRILLKPVRRKQAQPTIQEMFQNETK